MADRACLFNHCRVLLRHLVDLVDWRMRSFASPDSLFARRRRDVIDV